MTETHFLAIITHGNLSCEIKNVMEKLVQPTDHVYCYSNQTESLDQLEEDILAKIEKSKANRVLLISDLVGGSCWLLANRIKRIHPDAVVIGGVNIPLLVSYHMNLENLEWNALIEKIVEDGKKGILVH